MVLKELDHHRFDVEVLAKQIGAAQLHPLKFVVEKSLLPLLV